MGSFEMLDFHHSKPYSGKTVVSFMLGSDCKLPEVSICLLAEIKDVCLHFS